ncbi:MAG TPA: M20 family metallopeptidase [Candidatus Limnocylindrales bacterium]|nr:M20 family metallopeptidase [Candidatus Limnocylindrales bacterium]
MATVKDAIAQAVDRLGDELEALSHKIHGSPELGYKEVKASGWLTDFLAGQGFKVEKGVGGVETAFRATVETGVGPTIAILCEYDALPGIGHACGHNVIATAGAGAGAALAAVRSALPGGRIQVIGTPAEEGGGGKIRLIQAGVFKDVDCAMMIHGFDRTILHQDLLGIARASFEFTGKAAHAATDPWEGVNALDACIQTFNAVAMLRQQVRPECRIHGIITNGGAAANIIPEYAAATFYVRAPRIDLMWETYKRVVACAEGAAQAAGATLKVTPAADTVYEPLKRNQTLLDLFAANMKTTGLTEGAPIPDRLGSSDIGNVSQVIPTIQPMIGIAPTGMAIHTREFAAAAVKPLAREGMIAAAKTMAMTTFDLLADPKQVAAAKAEFARIR